jgi:molecular chaperone GrpE
MQPQNPAASSDDETRAGQADGGPVPSFAFTDKRKIDASGQPRAAAAGTDALGEGAERAADDTSEVDDASVVDDASAVEADPNEQLAAERLLDLQRLQAEYANYRKRVARDRDVARDTAIAAVIESLLPVLDDIQLARQHGDLESGPFVSIAEKLETTLARFGVERFGEPGAAFDPEVHDALMHVDEELAEGTDVTTVVGVLQPGYKIGDKVLRPARVSVADPQ